MMTTQHWHRKSKPTRSIVPVSHFVSPTVFALKNGGYGCLFSLTGIDDEGLTIGIGAAVTRRPLPHHRAYGSVHGGSRWLR